MLLTQKQPPAFEGIHRGFHDYIPPTPPSNPRFSPAVATAPPPLPPLPKKSSPRMTTPHRGLPPPAGLTLPPPERAPPPTIGQSVGQGHGQLPAAPPQWQGAEESMRNWLQAKAEEDRRKQEEEKTKQESLRLEQRKIEHSMLHESLQGGVPPYLVPMIFAGLGGPSMANTSLEWTQHYVAQVSQLQQQQYQQQALPASQSSPELRRESRTLAQPHQYGQQAAASVQAVPPPQQSTFIPPFPVTGMPPSDPSERGRAPSGPTSAPRPPAQSSLPRLNTAEMHIQPPPSGPPGPGAHPLSQTHSVSQEQTSPSTSIYFHHWVPPQSSQSSGNQPSTPSDTTDSPRKRKAQGPQQPAPMPSTTTDVYVSAVFDIAADYSKETWALEAEERVIQGLRKF